jgi:hypothetical protein
METPSAPPIPFGEMYLLDPTSAITNLSPSLMFMDMSPPLMLNRLAAIKNTTLGKRWGAVTHDILRLMEDVEMGIMPWIPDKLHFMEILDEALTHSFDCQESELILCIEMLILIAQNTK